MDRMTNGAGAPAEAVPNSHVLCRRVWPLICASLRRDPAVDGSLYMAVGSGAAALKGRTARREHAAGRLMSEVARQSIDEDGAAYLDADGLPVGSPTNVLRVTATFTWSDRPPALREFGLFGAASDERDSGFQINHVIHPLLLLDPGQVLTRTVDLVFGADDLVSYAAPSGHWLAQTPIRQVEGVGKVLAGLLQPAIATVADMAYAAPPPALQPSLAVSLRGRCRLILRSAGQLSSQGLTDAFTSQRPEAIVTASVGALAATGTAPDLIDRVRELLTVLESCLDHRYLNSFTVAELVSPTPART